MIRILGIATIAALVAACGFFEPRVTMTFTYERPDDAAALDPSAVPEIEVVGSTAIVTAAFLPPCVNGPLSADAERVDSGNLRLTVEAAPEGGADCESADEADVLRYTAQILVPRGTWSLDIVHRNDTVREDGSVHQETITVD